MARLQLSIPAVALAALALAAPAAGQDDPAARARRVHDEAIVLDTHIDTTLRMLRPGWSFLDRHEAPVRGRRVPGTSHVDLPRMREGGLDGAFFSIYMSGEITGPVAVKRSLELIDAVRGLVDSRPDTFALATTAAEVRAAAAAGKVAVLMGMEGGHMIAESLPVLRSYARLGVRYLTLTHSLNTAWADSSSAAPQHGGLTDFGREVVRELNRLGVMVDISHVSDETFADALETSRAPLLASHSSCRAISGHPRNLTDAMIKAMAAKGGVVQINYLDAYLDDALYRAQEERRPRVDALRAELEKQYPGEMNAEKRFGELMSAVAAMQPAPPKVSWTKIVDHIEHVAKRVGAEHVGLGSDFDGAGMPEGMEDVTRLPKITEELLRRGWSDEQVKGILGGNLLRLMERVEAVARESVTSR